MRDLVIGWSYWYTEIVCFSICWSISVYNIQQKRTFVKTITNLIRNACKSWETASSWCFLNADFHLKANNLSLQINPLNYYLWVFSFLVRADFFDFWNNVNISQFCLLFSLSNKNGVSWKHIHFFTASSRMFLRKTPVPRECGSCGHSKGSVLLDTWYLVHSRNEKFYLVFLDHQLFG